MKKNIIVISIVVIFLALGTYFFGENKDTLDIRESEKMEEQVDKEVVNIDDKEEVEEDKQDQEQEVSSNALELGEKVPDFLVKNQTERLKNLDGEEVFVKDYEGKTLLINFWSTSCVYCRAEMPDLQKVQDEYENVEVILVNVLDSKQTVKEFMEDGGYKMNVVMDEDGKLAQDFYVSAFPATYFVDKEGIFLGRFQGMLTLDILDKIIEDIELGVL